MNNKILITGGADFLGSHLAEQLLKEGNDVLVVDNYFTGSKMNLAHLLPNPNLEPMRHDATFLHYIEPIKSLTWLAQPHRYIIHMTMCKRRRLVCMARSIYSVLLK